MSQYLSMDQLVAYASRAGFKGDALRKIVAIAWAEGGGQVDAVGDGGDSVSTLQINLPTHPDLDRQKLLSDPAYAFQAAFDISGGGKNFDAWTTWSHRTDAGAKANAQQYLTSADKAIQAVGAAGGNIDLTPTTKQQKGGGVTTPTGTTSASMTGTMTAASAEDPKPTAASSPAEVEAYIRKHYPDVAPFLANEEIRKILFGAALAPTEIAPTEIEHQIRQTTYWQTHGVDSQAFDKLIGTNPAEAGALVDNAKQTLADFFDQQGVKYTDSQLGDAAKKSIRAGWLNAAGMIANPRALNDFAVFALNVQNPNGGLPSGTAASKADQLAQIAHDYLVPINRRDLERDALDIQAGKLTQDQFVHNISEQAKSLFHGSPQTVQQIDAGQTPYAIFSPQRTAIGKYFEVDANSIDLTDPKWADVLQMHDEAAKTTRPMTYGETIKWAMQNAPKNTQWYEQQDAAVANTLAKALGKVA